MKKIISDRLPYSTLLLYFSSKDNNEIFSTGTGFFFKKKENDLDEYIISNRHLIIDQDNLTVKLHCSDSTFKKPNNKEFKIQNINKYVIFHPDDDIDLCAINFSKIKMDRNLPDFNIEYFLENQIPTEIELEQLSSIEDILMIGYPNGLSDTRNNFPLVRRGITATNVNIDYNGSPKFLIDISSYDGSSGSPVIKYDEGNYTNKFGVGIGGGRFYFLGILYDSGVDFDDMNEAQKENYLNIGYVIKSSEIKKLLNQGVTYGTKN
jgi:hypothetical protein